MVGGWLVNPSGGSARDVWWVTGLGVGLAAK